MNPTAVLKGNLRKETNGQKPVITFRNDERNEVE